MPEIAGIDPAVPPSGEGCVECEAAGGWWVHLRRCAQCGHIGCCDTSPMQHATAHASATGHPFIRSFEPGEDWFYSYDTKETYEGPELAPPQHHPIDQGVPGPTGRVPSDWRQHVHYYGCDSVSSPDRRIDRSIGRLRRWTMEPDGSAQVAVFVDFENLVLGAVKELPDQANPAPYEALTRLCRGYGNASVRRAYADWANTLFGSHQDDLAMNGVDLIQVARVGIQNKNAADIRMAVDAMETLIVHPEVSVFILVSGDGDYSPLVQRLREFGKWVVGVGTEANASRKLVSVCSEYKYWGTLVAEVEPAARPVAAFDIGDAERLLVRALEESGVETMTAGGLKSKMLALDAAFDEHNYGARSFRAFLAMLPKQVEIVEADGPDLTVKLIEEPRKTTRTRTRKS